MIKLLTWQYWFRQPIAAVPPSSMKLLWLIIGVSLVLVIAGILMRRRAVCPAMQKVWGKMKNCGIANFIIGVLFFFFATENIPLLAMRFWYLAWLIGLLIWLGFFLHFLLKKVPIEKKGWEEKRKLAKYL